MPVQRVLEDTTQSREEACGRYARTCLEYTFASDAFPESAKADTAKCGAVVEFQNSVWSIVGLTSMKPRCNYRRGRNAIGSITLRAGDDRADV
jgi:hypothetical protein